MALLPGLPRWAGTIKVKPSWILLKQEIVSGSGISWAICKSAPGPRQITTPASHHSVFTGRMPFLPTINSVKALKAPLAVKHYFFTKMHSKLWHSTGLSAACSKITEMNPIPHHCTSSRCPWCAVSMKTCRHRRPHRVQTQSVETVPAHWAVLWCCDDCYSLPSDALPATQL